MSDLALTREQAAALCELSPSGFDVWVRKGIVPGPVKGTRRWSRVALSRALAGVVEGPNGSADDPEAIFAEWLKANAG